MATTSALEAEHWTANQNQPEVTVNESLDVFDAAIAQTLTHNFGSDADYTLVDTGAKPQEWQYNRVRLTDSGVVLTTGRNVVVPDNAKPYVIQNDTAQNLTVKTSAGSGIVVEPGSVFRVRSDGTDVISDEGVMLKNSEFRAYTETYVSQTGTGNINLSCASANVFNIILTGNTSVTFTDVPSIGSKLFTSTVFITQDGGGANSFGVGGSIYANGEASTVSQGGNQKDIWIFTTMDGGSTWYGMAAGLNFA